MLQALGMLCWIAALVCWVIVLIDMFQDEVWKGILGFLCGFYMLYYAFVEFDHEYKVLIIVGLLLGGLVGGGLVGLGQHAAIVPGF